VTAAERWSSALARWAIPKEILDAAPESPWGFPPGLFAHQEAGSREPTPSHRRAIEALPEEGEVLDVGVGGGAASLSLAPVARSITGVDQDPEMLASFAEAATAARVGHREVVGSWPAVAGQVPVADVVVCRNVLYNIGDLPPFARALTDHARRRVVVELTQLHPIHDLNPLWQHFHGITFPDEPSADDSLSVVREMGLRASIERWERPASMGQADRPAMVAFVRRRLCLPAEREAEVDRLLGPQWSMQPRRVATIWWDAGPNAQTRGPA
jgi:SAM-dependent methyltransferase